MKILYINSCVRAGSRTDRLARKLLQTLGEYTEIKLENESIKPLRRDTLEERTDLINKNNFSADIFNYARQFAEADIIVVSAPFWDLSFPALLKIYLENIYITGLVCKYDEKGMPKGLCKGKKLYYVTTAGGKFESKYSYDYIADLVTNYFGIKETELIAVEMLDIEGYCAEEIIGKALRRFDSMS